MKIKYLLVAIGLLGLLAACNAPLGSSANGTVSLSGIVGGSENQPSLQGLAIDASGASISADGEAASVQKIQPGVELVGTAERSSDRIYLKNVEIRHKVKGSIDSINLNESYIDVTGIRVHINAITYLYKESQGDYATLTPAELDVGDYVEVSGVSQPDDSILATRIEKKLQPSDHSKVSLWVRVWSLDTAAFTFTYGLRTYNVDYKNANVKGSLSENAWVRVQGTRDGYSILARKVEAIEQNRLEPGTKIELNGPISNLDSTGKSFVLLGFSVNYATAQVKGNLKDGAWVEVKGNLDSSHTVVAKEIEVKYERGGSGGYNGELKGPVSAVDPVGQTLQVQNQTLWADQNTLVTRNHTQVPFAEIRVGDWVEVKYDTTRTDTSGSFYAVRIELKDSSPSYQERELKGLITDFDTTSRTFVVNGVQVTVTPTTRYKVRDTYVSADIFWSTDRNWARAEAKGVLSGNLLEARKVEIK